MVGLILTLCLLIVAYFFVLGDLLYLIKSHKQQLNTNTLNHIEADVVGRRVSNLSLSSLDGKRYELQKFSSEGILLVFIDSECPHCTPALERFLRDVKGIPSLQYALVIKGDDQNRELQIKGLYGKDVLILRATNEIIQEFQVNVFPYFVYIKGDVIQYHFLIYEPLLESFKQVS